MSQRRRAALGAVVTTAALGAGLVLPVFGAIAPAAADQPPGKVVPGRGTGTPAFTQGIDDTVRTGTAKDVARAHLAQNGKTYQVATEDLVPTATVSAGDGLTTVRFQQRTRGVPVFGAEYMVQTQAVDGGRRVVSASGKVFSDVDADVTTPVGQDLARERLSLDAAARSVLDPQVVDEGLVVLPVGQGVAAWQFVVSGTDEAGLPVKQQVFIDAHVGGVALSYSDLHQDDAVVGSGQLFDGSEVPLQVTSRDDGTFALVDRSRAMYAETGGVIETYDAEGADYRLFAGAMPEGTPVESGTDADFDAAGTALGAVDAHVNAGKVYEYYRTVLGRDGIDGEGGTMRSVVNVTSNGQEYANAFWDGSKMVYGSSDGVPFSVSLDVVGHEMTHGVTEHSSNLVYLGQSGALNEAVSDYFGNAMETADLGVPMSDPTSGLIGEHLCAPGTAAEDCAIRDLNDGRRADADYLLMSVDYDNGGVHANSTIVGGALWDVRSTIDADVADQLVYLAQTQYLTPLSGFSDMRLAIEAAAERLKVGDDDLAAIRQAFDDHGIAVGWEEQAFTSDADVLATDIVSGYEGISPADDKAAAVSGSRWAASTLGAFEFFAGTYKFDIVTGELGHPGSTRTINTQGAWDIDPALDGDRLVWTRIEADEVDVVEQRGNGLGGVDVVAGGPGDQTSPAVSGDVLAWIDTVNGESDVYVRVGDAAPVNLTPETGTRAVKVRVRGHQLTWISSSRLAAVDLDTMETRSRTVPGYVFSPGTDVQLTEDGIFLKGSGLTTSFYYVPFENLAAYKKINTGRGLYDAQFTVNDEWFAYGSTTLWGSLTYPLNNENQKLMVAPVDAVKGGSATTTWQRVACGDGAQISAVLGDGQRIVWLDTSLARTDLVTREGFAGSC